MSWHTKSGDEKKGEGRGSMHCWMKFSWELHSSIS